MFHIEQADPRLGRRAIGVLAMAPGAVAAPPSPQDLNPAPPDFYTCTAARRGHDLHGGPNHEVKVSEEQPELVCGSGRRRLRHLRQRRGRLALHALVRRRRQPHQARRSREWTDAFWSNPLSGKTVPYTQTNNITTPWPCRGTSTRPLETAVGSNIYTDPVTHQKV